MTKREPGISRGERPGRPRGRASRKLLDQADSLVPGELTVERVQDRAGGVGEIDGEAAAALKFETYEGRGLAVAGNGVGKGGVEPGELVRRGAELDSQIAQIVEEDERRGTVVVALDGIVQSIIIQRVTVRFDDVPEGLREGLELMAIDQRDGAAAVLHVVVVVLLAIGHHVRLAIGKNIPGEDGIAHAVAHDFRRRDDELIGDVAKLPSHLDAAGQTDVQNEEIQVVRDGRGELGKIDPEVLRGLLLLADGTRVGIFIVIRRKPTASVRRNDHSVAPCRVQFADLVHHPPERFAGGADLNVRVGLEGVADGLAVLAAVDAHQHRRVGRDVVAGRGGRVDEGQDGLVVPQARENVALKVCEILLEVGAEVVVAHAIVDQHLIVSPLEGAVDAVAGRQDDGRQQQPIFL